VQAHHALQEPCLSSSASWVIPFVYKVLHHFREHSEEIILETIDITWRWRVLETQIGSPLALWLYRDEEDQSKRPLEHCRWSGSSSTWRERWKIGRMSNSSSFLDMRKSKQASKKLYLLALLVFVALVVSFMLARVGNKHKHPQFEGRRVHHRYSLTLSSKFFESCVMTFFKSPLRFQCKWSTS